MFVNIDGLAGCSTAIDVDRHREFQSPVFAPFPYRLSASNAVPGAGVPETL
ncbi:hypothetical protein KCP77_19445 [Salmonella enterica subsp. enterica]|nr:hypothetical protein KCP77_19445 [Salmonella enterica subsp. enterica]